MDTTAPAYLAYLPLFGRLTLGVTFALSGLMKLASAGRFVTSAYKFRLLPTRAARAARATRAARSPW